MLLFPIFFEIQLKQVDDHFRNHLDLHLQVMHYLNFLNFVCIHSYHLQLAFIPQMLQELHVNLDTYKNYKQIFHFHHDLPIYN